MFIYGLTDISIQLDMDEYLLYNLDNDSVEILDDEFIDLRLPFYNKLKEKLEKFYNSYKENRTSIQQSKIKIDVEALGQFCTIFRFYIISLLQSTFQLKKLDKNVFQYNSSLGVINDRVDLEYIWKLSETQTFGNERFVF